MSELSLFGMIKHLPEDHKARLQFDRYVKIELENNRLRRALKIVGESTHGLIYDDIIDRALEEAK